MKTKFWFDTKNDINRKWRRQAEFLVYNNFPIELILEIGVISEEMKTEVEGILRFFEKEIKVEVASDWYY
jgi:hypothetical protein